MTLVKTSSERNKRCYHILNKSCSHISKSKTKYKSKGVNYKDSLTKTNHVQHKEYNVCIELTRCLGK